ncbi:MAG: DUF4153 domain-containing protein [Alphaproteobacteria bacterium]|nr:MAG: DUF4153 domain-containing protein [Alphaproteobacteria bacterium]
MFFGKTFNNDVFLASLVGLVAGTAVWAIDEYLKVGNHLTTNGLTLLAFVVTGFAGFILTNKSEGTKTSTLFAVALAALISGLYFLLSNLYGSPIADYDNPTGSILLFVGILISYVGIGFFRARESTRKWAHYPALFRQAWNLPVIAILGFCFLGLGLGVFSLWAELFELIDITFFSDLLEKSWFYLPYGYTLVALGVSLVRQRENIVEALAAIAILLLRIVSPVILGFSLAFLIALAIVGLEPLWAATSATTTTTSLILLSAVIISTVVSSGEASEAEAHPIFLWSARGQALLLPAFAGIAIYSLWLRVDQYGWNVDRVLGALIVLFAFALALTYALSTVMPGWARNIRKANIALALFAVGLGCLVQTPLLSPFGISTRSQLDRLERGVVSAEEFDYGYLWFKLGRSGAKALETLESQTARTDHDVIVAGIKVAKSRNRYEVPSPKARIYTKHDIEGAFDDRFLVRPVEATLDPDFENALLVETELVRSCMDVGRDRPCLIVSLDLFGDELSEYIIFQKPHQKRHSHHCKFFYRTGASKSWESQTCWFTWNDHVNQIETWKSLEKGSYSLFEPRLKGIEINGTPYLFVPEDKRTVYSESTETPPQQEDPASHD